MRSILLRIGRFSSCLACFAVVLAQMLASAGTLLGQNQGPPTPTPRLSHLFPTGAAPGSTIELTVAGADLDEPTGLWINHSGITAEWIAPETEAEQTNGNEAKPKDKPKPAPTLARFRLTLAKDVPLGEYDIRFRGRYGVSNPRLFTVSPGEHVFELEPNNDAIRPEEAASGPRAQRIALGTTVHGVLANNTDVDYFVFAGKAGERVLVQARSSSIDSRARPFIEVFDTQGRRLAANRGYERNDALADVTLPTAGDYFIRVCEFAYLSGGADYVYQLTASTAPWIDAIHPQSINPNQPTQVTLYGRNLPGGKLTPGLSIDGKPLETLTTTITSPSRASTGNLLPVLNLPPHRALQNGFSYRFAGAQNEIVVNFATEPMVLESSLDNNEPTTAQELKPPVALLGQIERKADRDYFRFRAQQGETYLIDLAASQLGSEADVSLSLSDAQGNDLTGQIDDDTETLHPTVFFTRNTDPPAYRFTAPADGEYLVLVSSIDATVNYGPRCFYRLRITKPQPDFALVAMPRSRTYAIANNAKPGGSVAYDLFVQRQEGFVANVTVHAEGLPPGVSATPIVLGPHARWGTLIVRVSADAEEFCGPIQILGTAETSERKQLTRVAQPASIVYAVPNQNNLPTLSRADEQLMLAITREKLVFSAQIDTNKILATTIDDAGKPQETKSEPNAIYIRQGDKATFPIAFTWHEQEARANPIHVYMEPLGPVQNAQALALNNSNNVNNPAIVVPKESNTTEAIISARPNTLPGVYPVALRSEVLVPMQRDPNNPTRKINLNETIFLEPMTVFVAPKALSKLTIKPSGPVKPGETTKATVQWEAKHDALFPATIRLQFPEASGLHADDVKIPAGVYEAEFTITAAANAKPGNVNTIAQATIHYFGKFPTQSETQFTVNISK